VSEGVVAMGIVHTKRVGMTRERLAQILATYGSHPNRWPANERQAAVALLATHEQAQQVLAQEAELDAILAVAPTVEPSHRLRERILRAAPSAPTAWSDRLDRWASGLWPMGRSYQPLGALAAAAALGIAVGLVLPSQDTDADSSDLGDGTYEAFADLGDLP
jgi:hypothetical protein